MQIQSLDSRQHIRDQAPTPRLPSETAALAYFGKDQLRGLEDDVVQQKGRLTKAG
jgi:hypothetical protein